MSTRKVVLAASLAVGAVAVARPALDALALRVEAAMNPLLPGPATPPSERARALHATLRVADLHADSLLFGRDLVTRSTVGHVDIPRMIEGRVALQVFSMAVKTPAGRNIERNGDPSDEVIEILPMKVRMRLSIQVVGKTMLVAGTQMSIRVSGPTLKWQGVSDAGMAPAPSTWAMTSGKACTVASSPMATSPRASPTMSPMEREKRKT